MTELVSVEVSSQLVLEDSSEADEVDTPGVPEPVGETGLVPVEDGEVEG